MPSLGHKDYTVGWITALPVEMAAAMALLDETHEPLQKRDHDSNTYTLGRIGNHNVVIACLPSGTTGTVSAATVAQQMIATFVSIRFGMMLGIGGGIPSIGIPDVHQKNQIDIRLGDVVVSDPDHKFGGVVQYRFGKTYDKNHFVRTGTLNKPPAVLRTALASLKARHVMESDDLPVHSQEIARKFPMMRSKYSFQGSENDRLFRFDYKHAREDDEDCFLCDATQEIQRPDRFDVRPRIFYGLIASDNNLMRDGVSREELRKELGAICVEMEAAGLMDEFPCLVIRGICDYADSHKNKRWQAYAAANAASYAKELLLTIPSGQVDSTETAVAATGMNLFHLSSIPKAAGNGNLLIRDDQGRSALHIAAQLQDEDLVKSYLDQLTPEQAAMKDIGNFTALHLAKGHDGIVRALVDKMRPEDFGIVNCYLWTVLDESVMNWPISLTQLLLAKMLPEHINRQNISGATVLHLAVENGHEQAVPLLLAKMSDRAVWAKRNEPRRETALHIAARLNHVDMSDQLIAMTDDSVRRLVVGDGHNRTALHLAAEYGHVEIVQSLIKKVDSDDIWNSDNFGETALHKAVTNSHRDVVKLLLQCVEDPDDLLQRNESGQSAMDVARTRHNKKIIRLLESAESEHQNHPTTIVSVANAQSRPVLPLRAIDKTEKAEQVTSSSSSNV